MSFLWRVRKYKDGDEYDIVKLFKRTLANWRVCVNAMEHWRWRYWTNPAGPSTIWVAEHNNRIIGHYGVIPIRMKLGNAYVIGSCSSDGATDPRYQGRGVFSSIVNRCYLDVADQNIPVTFGFANARLGPTYGRYEWRGHICLMTNLIKVLNWEPILRRYLPSKPFPRVAAQIVQSINRTGLVNAGVSIERISRFDERIERFWRDVSNQFEIIVKKDMKYLNWRYVECPNNKYAIFTALKDDRVVGYCVLDQVQYGNLNTGRIVDILGLSNDCNVINGLLLRAIEFFKQHDAYVIRAMVSEKHPYIPNLIRGGFIPSPLHERVIHATINLRSSCIDEKAAYEQALTLSQNPFFKEKGNWVMMSGDMDRIPSLKYH